jgi:hypothetical protein
MYINNLCIINYSKCYFKNPANQKMEEREMKISEIIQAWLTENNHDLIWLKNKIGVGETYLKHCMKTGIWQEFVLKRLRELEIKI